MSEGLFRAAFGVPRMRASVCSVVKIATGISAKFFLEILTTEYSETPSATLKTAMEIHVFEILAALDPHVRSPTRRDGEYRLWDMRKSLREVPA